MNVIVEDSANLSMDNIFYYNLRYSLQSAIETDNKKTSPFTIARE